MITRNRGFGLVEIMVGLMVGLISMVVVMQVYSVFENQKRATTTGGDAQSNGALALYLMEREVRAAGNGMTEGEPHKYPPLAGCMTHFYDSTSAYLVPNTTSPFVSTVVAAGMVSSVRLAPVVVSDGDGGLSDSLTIIYGTATITAPYTTSGYTPGALVISLTGGAAGIGVNGQKDIVALIQEDADSPNKLLYPNEKWKDYKTPTPCSLLQVTCPVSAAGCPSTLTVSTGRYNKGGGTGLIPFADGTRLYNLGQLNLVTYRINGSNLVADISKFGVVPDGGVGTAVVNRAVVNRTDFSPLASNIVNMQAQYGIDIGNAGVTNCKTNGPSLDTTDADSVVDAWVDATGQWANNGLSTPSLFDLRRIRAVRIGLVARSGVKASGKTDDLCNTVAPVIHWDSGVDMTPDLSTDADWQCYRYKVFQITIPIRNALWSSTMNPASTASCGVRDPS